MLDVSWVDEQLERVRCATATMQTARDYALLCIARDHLAPKADQEDRKPRTNLVTAPTLEDVERDLERINVSTREDRRKAQELREVTRIMQGT